MEKIKILQNYIDRAEKIVFFGGAGVSTESGIKDFRSVDGLYNEKYDYPPEVILSHSFFEEHPLEFFNFYRDKLNSLKVLPNITHNYLKKLDEKGKLLAIVTQNIDGLHEKTGCKNIYLLHGTIYQNHCMKCGKSYDAEVIFDSEGIPTCTCGGIIKPDVVLYEEPLKQDIIEKAIQAISNCDLLIVAGTSLSVYPAAGFINYFNGKHLVIINKDATQYDTKADLVINEKLGDVFKLLH